MHMTDALMSPAVAGVMDGVSVSLLAVAVRQVGRRADEGVVPLMGVLGAFVFAAQMVNFAIPGTGASGHLVGGVLLAALLGPWAALTVMASVLILQCLLLGDGGLMALGCNLFNMAVCSCLVAYPLIFRPLMRPQASWRRLLGVSVLTCLVGLELGAAALAVETAAAGITALPLRRFLPLMLLIHLPMGLCEGVATALLLRFVQRYKPDLLTPAPSERASPPPLWKRRGPVLTLVLLSLLLLTVLALWFSSSLPDGMEWAIGKVRF